MTNDNNALRPEASPVSYWKHHKRAKEALNFIIRILNGAASSVSDSKGIADDHSIDTNRASRIVFISGEPGSGKSTLYLTLRAMLRSKEYSEGYEDQKVLDDLKKVRWLDALDLEVAGEEGENLLAAVLVRLFRELEKSESNPIHSSKCGEAIKELEDLATDIGIAWEGNLHERAGALDPDTFSAEVIRTQGARLRINERLKEALDTLAKNECYGCDQKTLFVLPVDDFYLKPTASLQLLRLLRMISIPRLFFLVMGDIKTVEALFIEKSLADWTEVSGASLFATRSDRLDQALIRARELRARYLRKLLPPLQRADIEAMDWFEALDFETKHTSGSGGNISHEVNPNDTLEKLLDEVKLDEPRMTGVETTLRKFLISPELLPTELNEWRDEKLKRQNRAKGKAEDAEKEDRAERNLKKAQSAYTALQIMDATPREIMDLAFALRDVDRKREAEKERIKKEYKHESNEPEDIEKNPELLLTVMDMVDLVREEQSFLNETEQNVLEAVLPTRRYSPEDIHFSMDRLCLKPTERNWSDEEIKDSSGRLWFRDHRSWDLSVNRKFITDSSVTDTSPDEVECLKANKDPYAKLPPRQAAWYVLLHDLAWEWNRDCVTGNLVERLRKELEPPVWKRTVTSEVNLEQPFQDAAREAMKKFLTLYERSLDQSNKTYKTKQEEEKQKPNPQDDFRGWAVYSIDEAANEAAYNHFPMPKFETIRDLDRFLFVWSSGLKCLKNLKEHDVSKIASIWALAGWTVLAEAYEHFVDEGDRWFEGFVGGEGTFDKRFKVFKDQLSEKLKGKGKTFEYPTHNEPKISAWKADLDDLNKLPEQFQVKESASTASEQPPSTTPQATSEVN